MKNILLLLFVLLSQILNAGTVIGAYRLSYLGETFSVEAVRLKNNKFSVYIGVKAQSSKTAYINVDGKKLEKFKKALIDTKEKYIEWSKAAKDNNVVKMNKFIGVKFPKVSTMWHHPTEVYFSINNDFDPIFTVLESGEHLIVIAMPVRSAMNRYITESLYLPFSSPDEIDALLLILDENNIKTAINNQVGLDNLFK